MPLMPGKSKAAFGHNVRAEMHAGKPQKQAVAIAYSEKRKRMADGGTATPSPSPTPDPDIMAMAKENRDDLPSGSEKPMASDHPLYDTSGYADGGEVDSDHESLMDQCAAECMKAKTPKEFRQAFEVLMSDLMTKMRED